MKNETLVETKNLQTFFYTDEGIVRAVDGVDIKISVGETLGLVGESGCGKSVTSLSIMRLVPWPPGKIVAGEIWFKGEDILKKSEEEMRRIRGSQISMIFQEPMTSLNPVFTVGYQISEAILVHQDVTEEEAKKRAIEMLDLVGIPDPEKRYNEYPHQMSGGMRQRVMIAMALSCNPDLLISDEATTALDVTIQAQILELMKDLKRKIGMAILLITHNLSVIAEMADNVAVMYAGKIVEYSDIKTIFKSPQHPYTYGLLNSIPLVTKKRVKGEKLAIIEGVVPNPYHLPKGCYFHPRCPYSTKICREEDPKLEEIAPGHFVKCWNYLKPGMGV